jgi:hypothetical protein
MKSHLHLSPLARFAAALWRGAVALLLFAILTGVETKGEIARIEFSLPDLAVQFNGVANTHLGPHSFIFTVDTATADQELDTRFGAFPTLSAVLNAPGLGLFNVAIVNPTYLFTNNAGPRAVQCGDRQPDLPFYQQ